MRDNTYQEALFCIESGDYKKAKMLLASFLNDKEYKNFALANLIYLNSLTGNYKRAREFASKAATNVPLISNKIALLEKLEFNFKRAISYYEKLLNNPNYQKEALFHIARLYIDIKEYNVALKILETLSMDSSYSLSAKLNLIQIYALEGDYEHAFYLLNEIDGKEIINQKLEDAIRRIRVILTKKLNLQVPLENLRYDTRRFLFDDYEELIAHLKEKHLEKNDKRGVGYFFPDTDFPTLIEDVKREMPKYNASYLRMTSKRIIELPYEVGTVDSSKTRAIMAVNFIGNDNIITMYPVLVSNEFDSENQRKKNNL